MIFKIIPTFLLKQWLFEKLQEVTHDTVFYVTFRGFTDLTLHPQVKEYCSKSSQKQKYLCR